MTEIRFIERDELAAHRDAISRGFGYDPPDPDEHPLKRFEAINPVETSISAFDRGHIVATFGSYDLDLTLPGGSPAATAGTTHVTVHPTHRRRGILTEMMRLHLDQAVERGQPMAALWASEERIYGRFGYGPAVYGHQVDIEARAVEAAAPHPEVTVHPLTVDEARSVLPPLYQRQRSSVAGRLARSPEWWEHRIFHDPKSHWPAASRKRHVVAERAGVPVGYLAYRVQPLDDWGEGRTHVIELIAVDDDARRALWHFATNIDLYRNVRWWNAPVDDPLVVEADRFRNVARRIQDSVWIRPLDVPALLEARSYEGDGTAVLGVHDGFGPTAGRYRLEVSGGRGHCQRTTDPADAELDVAALGRLVLGGVSPVTLQRSGLLDGTPEAAAGLHRLLVTARQPHCPEVF